VAAGIEIRPDVMLGKPDPEKLVATGFLRMGPWEQTGMSVAAVTRQEWLDDVTHTVATSFLGITMECARCHDHKFDAISTRDYYALSGYLQSSRYDVACIDPPEERRAMVKQLEVIDDD
jgi:hypothetical protein